MGRATFTKIIEAAKVDGIEQHAIDSPYISFDCDDFAFCPVAIRCTQEFVDKACEVYIDDLITLGKQLEAFKNSRKT